MSWLSELIHHPAGLPSEISSSLKNWAGDISKGVGQAGHQLGQWGGDIEHGFSQVEHNPWVRGTQEAAAAALLAIYAPELIPEMASAMGTTDAAVSAADLAAMSAEGSADIGAAAGATEAATAADIAAGVPGAAGTAAATAGTAATAADAAAAGASMLPEVTVSGTPLAAQPMLNPAMLFAAANPAINPLTYTGGAQPGAQPTMKSAMGVQIADPTAGMATSPPLLNAADVNIMDPTQGGAGGFLPGGGYIPPDPGSDIALENAANVDIADPTGATGQPGFWSRMGKGLATPKGALTAASLGMNLYGLMNRAQLPGAAKTALGAAGPATAQAQAMISAGGMAGPLWQQQKAGIDANIDLQKKQFAEAVQQNAANAGMGGANSDVVQQQIQTSNMKLEALREQMYMQAAQQNVSNAVAELTGGNQTLMSVAQLQFQEDQYAQQLAKDIGISTGQLAALWPSG